MDMAILQLSHNHRLWRADVTETAPNPEVYTHTWIFFRYRRSSAPARVYVKQTDS